MSVREGGRDKKDNRSGKPPSHCKPTQIFPLLEVVVELFPRGEVILGAVVAVEVLERGARG